MQVAAARHGACSARPPKSRREALGRFLKLALPGRFDKLSIGIYLAPGAYAVETSTRVNETLNTLAGRFPAGMKKIV